MKEAGKYKTLNHIDYIAGEQFNYQWSRKHIDAVKAMYREGYDIRDITDKLRKTKFGDIEVFLLIADLICRGYLEERTGKVFGNREVEHGT